MKVRRIVRVAVIAALYAAITLALAPFSFGPVQLRASEALTLLPVLLPEAPFGLLIGCVLANLVGGYGMLDVVFGSLATLLAAFATRKLARQWFLAPLPPVVFNGIIVGYVLHAATGIPWAVTALDVSLGEVASCYGLGLPFLYALKKLQHHWQTSPASANGGKNTK